MRQKPDDKIERIKEFDDSLAELEYNVRVIKDSNGDSTFRVQKLQSIIDAVEILLSKFQGDFSTKDIDMKLVQLRAFTVILSALHILLGLNDIEEEYRSNCLGNAMGKVIKFLGTIPEYFRVDQVPELTLEQIEKLSKYFVLFYDSTPNLLQELPQGLRDFIINYKIDLLTILALKKPAESNTDRINILRGSIDEELGLFESKFFSSSIEGSPTFQIEAQQIPELTKYFYSLCNKFKQIIDWITEDKKVLRSLQIESDNSKGGNNIDILLMEFHFFGNLTRKVMEALRQNGSPVEALDFEHMLSEILKGGNMIIIKDKHKFSYDALKIKIMLIQCYIDLGKVEDAREVLAEAKRIMGEMKYPDIANHTSLSQELDKLENSI